MAAGLREVAAVSQCTPLRVCCKPAILPCASLAQQVDILEGGGNLVLKGATQVDITSQAGLMRVVNRAVERRHTAETPVGGMGCWRWEGGSAC